MNAIVKSLLDEARKLTPDERIELVEELLAGIEPGLELDRLWHDEIVDRLAAYRRGALTARDANEVFAKYGIK